MGNEICETNEIAMRKNAKELIALGQGYAQTGLLQVRLCKHKLANCDLCKRACADLHYFAVALAIIGTSAIEGKQSELFELITNFAKDNLQNFPAQLCKPLYVQDSEFPDYIEESEVET